VTVNRELWAYTLPSNAGRPVPRGGIVGRVGVAGVGSAPRGRRCPPPNVPAWHTRRSPTSRVTLRNCPVR